MSLDFSKYPVDLNNVNLWGCWVFLDRKKSKKIMGNLTSETEIIPCNVNNQLYGVFLSSSQQYLKHLIYDPIENRYCLVTGAGNVGTAVCCYTKNSIGTLNAGELYYQAAKDNEGFPILISVDCNEIKNYTYLAQKYEQKTICRKDNNYKFCFLGGENSEFDIDINELMTQNSVEKEGVDIYDGSGNIQKNIYVFKVALINSNLYSTSLNRIYQYYRANTTEYPQSIDYDYVKGYSDKEICGIYFAFSYNAYGTTGFIKTQIKVPENITYFIDEECPIVLGSRVFKFENMPFGLSGEFVCIRPFRTLSLLSHYVIKDDTKKASYYEGVINAPYRDSENAPNIILFVNNGKDWNGITFESGFYIFEDNRQSIFSGNLCSYYYCPFGNDQTLNKNYTDDYNLCYYNFFPGVGFSNFANWTFKYYFISKNEDDTNPNYDDICYSYKGLTLQKNIILNKINNDFELEDSYTLFNNHYSNYSNYNYDHNKCFFGDIDDSFNLQGI